MQRGTESGAKRVARFALLGIGVVASLVAGYRFFSTRSVPTAPRTVVVTPARGPVGMHPFVELAAWAPDTTVQIRFCAAGSDTECAEMGSGQGRERVRVDRIPDTLPSGSRVAPGSYEIVAIGGERTERTAFEVVPFTIGPRPRPHAWTALPQLSGEPRLVAEGAACVPYVAPDGRLLVAQTLFEPNTAVTYDVPVSGLEMLWSPDGDRLAIVVPDRKEIRLAGPDGSDAQAVIREARGLVSGVSWAPDGDRFAFVARPDPSVRGGPARPTVTVFNLLDGSRRELGPGEAVAWSPAEDLLAVEVAEGGTRSIDTVTLDGVRTRLGEGRRPAWSPDGSLVAFVRTAGAETGEGWVATADGQSQSRLVEGPDVCGLAFTAEGRRLVVSNRAGDSFSLSVTALVASEPG